MSQRSVPWLPKSPSGRIDAEDTARTGPGLPRAVTLCPRCTGERPLPWARLSTGNLHPPTRKFFSSDFKPQTSFSGLLKQDGACIL